MTATFQVRGTIGTGSTSVTPGLPTGLANGDLALLMVVTKPDTATIATPSGWTLVANVAGGGGTTGLDAGPTRQAWFSRVKDASWSTAPTVAVTSGNSTAVVMVQVTGTTGFFDVTAATGVFGTAAAVTDCASTLGSDPGITTDDLLVVGYSNMSDDPTWSAEGITVPGVTVGTVTERFEIIETSVGNDVGGLIFTASPTAGTSSGAPSTQATASAVTRGTAALVRVRDTVAATQYPAAGTVDATSTTTGAAAARLTGSGTVAGTSATTGAVTARLAASGTTAAGSATTGAATRTSPASGTVAATSDTIGAATALLPAAGTAAATSGTTGSASVIGATQQLPASGTVAITSATIGAATAALAAAGISVAQATATGSASALLDTAGSVEAVSGTSGAADVIVAVVEPPTPQRRIVSAVLTIPTLAADLEVPGSIAATLTAAGTLRADLTIPEARGVLT